MIQLHENEKIVLQKRRHWYAIVAESFMLAVAAIALATLFFAALVSPAIRTMLDAYLGLVLFVLATWLLLLWMVFFVLFTNYYLDVLIITNKRLIDIEQHGLFTRDLVEVRLDKVQDIKVKVFGVLASLLDFGDLHIQTAGSSREVVVHRIAHPQQVREVISKYHNKIIK